jgi:hypothetical protein
VSSLDQALQEVRQSTVIGIVYNATYLWTLVAERVDGHKLSRPAQTSQHSRSSATQM